MKAFLFIILALAITSLTLFYGFGTHSIINADLAAQQANNSDLAYMQYQAFNFNYGPLITGALALVGLSIVYRKSN